MDAVIAFAVRDAAALWLGQAGRGMVRDMTAMVGALGGVRAVHVVTDLPELFDGCRVDVTAAIPPAKPGMACLPPDLAWALRVLESQGKPVSEEILAVNIRNPFLDAAALGNALGSHERGVLLLGAVSPSDHPCQFFTPMVLEDAGVACLLEDDPGMLAWVPSAWGRDCVVTKPFSFDWPVAGQSTLGFYLRAPGDGAFLPMRPADGLTAGPVWVRLAPDVAAVAMLRDEFVSGWGVEEQELGRVLGANISRLPGEPPMLVLAGEEPGMLTVAFPRPGTRQGRGILKLVSCSPGACGFEDVATVDFDATGTRARIKPKTSGAGALTYFLLRIEEEQGHDFMMHFVPGSGLWHFDSSQGACVNSATGQPIMGRQQFPLVLEPDGSFAAGTVKDVRRAEELLFQGSARLYPLERQWGFRDDRLAIAQYQAITGSHDPY